MEKIYLEMWELAKAYYKKGRLYDIQHVEWMMNTANEIADVEKVNKKLLLPIVILHDVGYSLVNKLNPNIKDPKYKLIHMREGAIIAEKILKELNYDENLKNKIVHYVSVHDNWIIGDDKPFKECREMAIFNDLEFLFTLTNHKIFVLMGESMGKTPEETYDWWLQDEKLTRRPFNCDITKNMFNKCMSDRKRDIELSKP